MAPKRAQDLLGHKTLAMTTESYAKVRRGTARQAIARLSYGVGAQTAEHVIEFSSREKSLHNIPTVGNDAMG